MSYGFGNIAEYANADELGQTWFTSFRKVANSTATVTSSYVDYGYYSGTPLANFYASTPLEAAYIDETRGIRVPNASPLRQYLKNITCMTAASSASNTASRNQKLMLADYLMYYPFIDTDSTDQQDMVQSVTLPRYSYGHVMAISQSASSTIGQFTMKYTNQNGVANRTSVNTFTQIVSGGGQSLVSNVSGGGFNPFIPLQAGDTGVKSIESVTFTQPGGGLLALVIVKPIQIFFLFEECRTSTTGNIESYGSATSFESLLMKAGAPEIKNGAVLGLISKCQGGSLASSTLSGYIETVWN